MQRKTYWYVIYSGGRHGTSINHSLISVLKNFLIHRSNLYIVAIIAGPDGAGKTTFAREFLPHNARYFAKQRRKQKI